MIKMDQTDDSGSFYNNQMSTDLSTDKELNTDIETSSNTSIHKNIKIFIDKANSYHGKYILKALRTKINNESPKNLSNSNINHIEQTSSDQPTSQDEDQKSQNDVTSSTDDLKNEPKINEIIDEKIQYQITVTLDPDRETAIEADIDFCTYPDAQDFHEILLEQDFIIYDINFCIDCVNDALKTIKLLENWCKNSSQTEPKHFILISNLMTWALTEPFGDLLLEKNYRKRRPHPCYRRHLRLEQEVANIHIKYKEKIKTIIICPGITYGDEEDILHYFFKAAFYNKEEIDIFEPGTNFIPLLGVENLGYMIKAIIDHFPSDQQYVLAHNPDINYLEFVNNACKLISGIESTRFKICKKEQVMLIDHNLLTQRMYDKINLNLKMDTTFFKTFAFDSSIEKETQMAVGQYYQTRNIRPHKILIHGPPSCGKTTLAKALACYYGLHYIDPENILNDTLIHLERKIKRAFDYIENQLTYNLVKDDPLHREMLEVAKANIDLWNNETIQISEAIASKDESTIEALKEKYLKDRLNSNACSRNQGYIIDTLLYNIDAIKRIFLDSNIPESTELEDESESQEIIRGKKVSYVPAETENEDDQKGANIEEKQVEVKLNAVIKPELFIYFKFDEILLQKEEKCICKEYQNQDCDVFSSSDSPYESCNDDISLEGSLLDELLLKDCIKQAVIHNEKKRLENFRQTEFEDVSLYSFMLDYGIIPFEIIYNRSTDLLDTYKETKQKLGVPNDYIRSEAKQRRKELCEEMKKKEKEHKEKIVQNTVEKARLSREKQLEKEFNEIIELKRQEVKEIEARSLPLREYLMKYILPKLTDGLLQLSEIRPQDPIDFLAEFLFKNNLDGKMFDPCLTEHKIQEIMRQRLAEMSCSGKNSVNCSLMFEESDSDYYKE